MTSPSLSTPPPRHTAPPLTRKDTRPAQTLGGSISTKNLLVSSNSLIYDLLTMTIMFWKLAVAVERLRI